MDKEEKGMCKQIFFLEKVPFFALKCGSLVDIEQKNSLFDI
jgi:hypothetical protein